MRLLVTGGAGFIGSEFVRQTIANHPEDSVVVLDKLTYAGNVRNLDPVASDTERSASSTATSATPRWSRRWSGDVDAMVNFAAESHVDRSLEAPGQFIQTDVFGTYVLLEAARRRRRRAVPAGVDRRGVRRRRGGHAAPRATRCARAARTRRARPGGEMMVWAYRASYGLPVITTRGSNTYGPYQYPEKIIPLFITNAIDDQPLPIYGDGSAVRDYIHVADHARGIDTALRAGTPGEDYNVGYGGATNGARGGRPGADGAGQAAIPQAARARPARARPALRGRQRQAARAGLAARWSRSTAACARRSSGTGTTRRGGGR